MDRSKLSWLILWSFALILVDLFSTYLVTPDLKLEANFYVRYFGLNWLGTIFFALIQGSFFALLFFLSVQYLRRPSKKRLLEYASLLGIGLFFFHLVGSALASVNNFLNYLYLHEEGCLSLIAGYYSNNINGHMYFLTANESLKFIAAAIITPYFLKKIRTSG